MSRENIAPEQSNNEPNNAINISNDEYMLTTYDNPYNPFEQFNLWFKYDLMLGHNSCGLLEKTANVNNIQNEEYNEQDVQDAIDYIVSSYPMIYKKVSKSDFK